MLQIDPVVKTIDGVDFYIRPLPAMKAANISGDIFSLVAPAVGASGVSLFASKDKFSLADTDIVPVIASALSSINGDRVEAVLRKLLLEYGNIVVDDEEHPHGIKLNEDRLDELFAGKTQNLFVLAAHVIAINYGGFFDALRVRFGDLFTKLALSKSDMESSTPDSSATSS